MKFEKNGKPLKVNNTLVTLDETDLLKLRGFWSAIDLFKLKVIEAKQALKIKKLEGDVLAMTLEKMKLELNNLNDVAVNMQKELQASQENCKEFCKRLEEKYKVPILSGIINPETGVVSSGIIQEKETENEEIN